MRILRLSYSMSISRNMLVTANIYCYQQTKQSNNAQCVYSWRKTHGDRQTHDQTATIWKSVQAQHGVIILTLGGTLSELE